MKRMLTELYWWADYHRENIGVALLVTALLIPLSPFIMLAFEQMYENATTDVPRITPEYWIERGYDPYAPAPRTVDDL